MRIRRTIEPETLSSMIKAALHEPNAARRATLEGRLRDVREEMLLARIAEFIVGESGKTRSSLLRQGMSYLSMGFLLALILLGTVISGWMIALLFFLYVVMFGLFEVSYQRRELAVSQGIRRVLQLSHSLKSGSCVGPLLDVLGTSRLEKSQQRELLECLRAPLIRMEPEQIAALTAAQLRVLEQATMGELNEQVALAGLLVLGNAGYRVTEWDTVLSWARAPTRQGLAAREYLMSVGSVVR